MPSNGNLLTASQAAGLNLSKSSASRLQQQLNQPEISCMPVSQILALQQQQQNQNSLLQQQLQRNQRDMKKLLPKPNIFLNMVSESRRCVGG